MTRGMLISAAALLLTTAFGSPSAMGQQPPVATFKAGVDLVQISAVVRDRKGRFVEHLSTARPLRLNAPARRSGGRGRARARVPPRLEDADGARITAIRR